jgi:hypothetical protein
VLESSERVTEANDQTNGHAGRRRIALIATYGAALALGYALGFAGLLPYGPLKSSTSTPLARIGLALKDGATRADAADWARLRDDVASVRSSFGSPERDVFDLVVALRGLANGGTKDLVRAAQSCRELGFPRCDDQALEVVRGRSRP